MRVIRAGDDVSPQHLYPKKRKYFSLYFLGYKSDLMRFEAKMAKIFPSDFPIIIFFGEVDVPSQFAIDHARYASGVSNAAVMWTSADSEFDMSFNPMIWSAQMGRFISSNKKCFFGASVVTPYKAIANLCGYENWYSSLDKLCQDLAAAINGQLLESITVKSEIRVRSGVA